MMNELTREESEKCAKACGWEKWCVGVSVELGVFEDWFDEQNRVRKRLPLDPCFWFGRLWDKACELASTKEIAIETKYYGGFYHINVDHGWFEADDLTGNPCLALCDAIEKIQNSQEERWIS